jgi:hypothetical protein
MQPEQPNNNPPAQQTMPPQQPAGPTQIPQQPSQQPADPLSPHDPGKTLAIVSIVLGLFLPLVGLILAIVAKTKSSKVGLKNSVAVVGIILNSLLIFFQVIMLFLVLNSFSGIQSDALDIEAKSDINAVNNELENFYATNGYYPGSLTDLINTDLTIDAEALVEPTSDYRYSYEASPTGCSDDCTSYQLQVVLSDGSVYTKDSTN